METGYYSIILWYSSGGDIFHYISRIQYWSGQGSITVEYWDTVLVGMNLSLWHCGTLLVGIGNCLYNARLLVAMD